jgi:hypothetical protein
MTEPNQFQIQQWALWLHEAHPHQQGWPTEAA